MYRFWFFQPVFNCIGCGLGNRLNFFCLNYGFNRFQSPRYIYIYFIYFRFDYRSKRCDWSTSSVNPLLECLSYGNHECRPINELSHTVTNVSSVMNVCNNPLDPDRGGLRNTIGCLSSVIWVEKKKTKNEIHDIITSSIQVPPQDERRVVGLPLYSR